MTLLTTIHKLSKATLDCSLDLTDDVAYIAGHFAKSVMMLFVAPLLLLVVVTEFLCEIERKMK